MNRLAARVMKRRGAFHVVSFLTFLMLVFGVYLALQRVRLTWPESGWSESIYFVTGLVLLWYTIETWKLRHEMQRQTNIQVRPLLSIAIQGAGINQRIVLRNVGLGPARSITVSDPELAPSVKLSDGFLTALAQGDEAGLPGRVFHPSGGEVPSNDRDWTVASHLSKGQHEVSLTYASLSAAWYETKIRFTDGTARIAEDEEVGVPAAERRRQAMIATIYSR